MTVVTWHIFTHFGMCGISQDAFCPKCRVCDVNRRGRAGIEGDKQEQESLSSDTHIGRPVRGAPIGQTELSGCRLVFHLLKKQRPVQ